MQEQFDKRLADKIRQEMEAYEPPYDQGHWADMQKRLGRRPNNYYRWILAACAALLLVTLAYLPLGDATLTNQVILGQSETGAVQTDNDNNYLQNGVDSIDSGSGKKQMLADLQNEQNTIGEDENKALQTATLLKRNSATNKNSNKVTSENKSSKQLALQGKQTNKANIKKAFDLSEANIIEDDRANVDVATEKENISAMDVSENATVQKEDTGRGKEESIIHDIANAESLTSVSLEVENIVISNKQFYLDSVRELEAGLIPMTAAMPKGIKGFDRFYFSVLAEGFLNQNSRVNNYRQVGFSLGFTANYSLNEKMVIASGLIFKQMHGKAFPNQSRFGQQEDESFSVAAFPGFSANSINRYVESTQEMTELVTTTAHLSAVEIPIQFNYYFSTNVNRRFYIGGAASSYFYLSERYEYEKEEFQLPTQSNIRKLSIVNEEVTYGAFEHIDFFSTITLSVGMEKAVGLHSSVSIEPFWSIPVLSMGQERIPINSTGLRLKYNFGR